MERLWHKAGARECITGRRTWSKIPSFHLSSPCLHQTVSDGSWFFPSAAKDGHCLSPLLAPGGEAWETGVKRSKCLWTVPWCCSSRAVPEPVLCGCCAPPDAHREPQVLSEPQLCADLCCVCALLPPPLLALAGGCWYPGELLRVSFALWRAY